MLSTTSYIFSNDGRATAFRRAVRSDVAHRQEYVVPGSGASAQEVQRAYLRYCQEQQEQGQSDSAHQAPPSYTPSVNNQAPPPYTPFTDDQAPPPYTYSTVSNMTPTAQLNMLLYSNTSTPPSPPEYTEAIATPPPSYESVVATRITSDSTTTTTDQPPSRTRLSTIFAGCTTRTSRKQVQKQAIQALDLVVVPRSGVSGLPARPSKKPGILRRMRGKVQDSAGSFPL
ncbi:hypothetical protein KCU98_g8276, partial [Aureobasidium melanogenum]